MGFDFVFIGQVFWGLLTGAFVGAVYFFFAYGSYFFYLNIKEKSKKEDK